MCLRFHGIEHPAPNCQGRFHFAVWRFLSALEVHDFWPVKVDPSLPPWPDLKREPEFRGAVGKLKDTFDKLLRVAGMFERRRQEIEEHRDSPGVEESLIFGAALADIPIHLDSILFYLRVFADCLANATPYLYGREGASLPHRSFRKHRNGFAEKHTSCDAAYAGILQEETAWFDKLAGKGDGKGLRDKVVHHRAKFQLSWTVDSEKADVRAGLVGDYGWVSDDVIPEVVDIVRGLFRFLDRYVEHFVDKVGQQIGEAPFALSRATAGEALRFNKPLPGFWLFPKARHPSS